MKKLFTFGIIVFAATCANAQQKPLMGFTPATSTKQLQTEQQFDQSISADRISATLKVLSAFPHHIGSPGGKVVAVKILQKFK